MSDSESSAPSKGSSDDQHDADFQPPQAKRTKFIQSSASGNSKGNFKPLQSLEFNLLGSYKYAVRGCDDKIKQIIGIAHPHKNLVTAAYADATWKKIFSAYNSFLKFCVAKNFNSSFPIDEFTLGSFIDWATFENRVSPSTISAYISHLRLIHKLKGISTVGCDSFFMQNPDQGCRELTVLQRKKL